ncbi:MAG: GDP-mannose 4,6-dehydratase [Bacteroidetes bacterium]|nr:GDP-mannose 4,6-dehydratase [Bacteroidota bacterium]
MDFNSLKVVVTGASGFIGSHLAERLTIEGADVRCFVKYNSRNSIGNLEYVESAVRKNLKITFGNVEDPILVKRLIDGADIVFHLASLIGIPYSYIANYSYVQTNVLGTLHVLQACREHSVSRLVHISTSEVFGSGQYFPMDELHPLNAQSPYAASKIAADKLVQSFICSYDLPAVIIRPFNTFGPRQSSRAIIPSIVSQLFRDDELHVGTLSAVRDFTFVDDIVSGIVAAGIRDQILGEEINLGTGRGVQIKELVDKCVEITGCQKKVRQTSERLRPPKSEVMKLICNATKARSLLDWSPSFTVERGLVLTASFIKNNLSSYQDVGFAI